MADIIPDGNPIEEPEASAETAYQNIPSTFGQFLGSQIDTTIGQIGRVAQQGMYVGSSGVAQWLRSTASPCSVDSAPRGARGCWAGGNRRRGSETWHSRC